MEMVTVTVLDLDRICGFCLCEHSVNNPVTVEDEFIHTISKKVLYFEIIRNDNGSSLVCESCKETLVVFYEYAEQVSKNQALKPTAIKQEPEDETTEWDSRVAVEMLCEVAKTERSKLKVVSENESEDDENDAEFDDTDYVYKADDSEEDTEEEKFVIEEVKKPKRKYTPRKGAPPAKKGNVCRTTPEAKEKAAADEQKLLQQCELTCDLCDEPQENFLALLKHFKAIHNQRGYYKCCDKKFFKRCWMMEHIQLHLNPDTFHCALCNKSYSSSAVLKEHTKQVHAAKEDLRISCETCHKTFVSKSHLNAHLAVAHGTIPCPQCPKTLASRVSLRKHLVVIHGEGEQFICDVCARVFRSQLVLKNHVKRHLGTRVEDKVQCKECLAWFTDQNCLNKHVKRKHEISEVPLDCSLCDYQAKNRPSLYNHVRQVHSESKYECEMCGKKFKRQHHMREHIAIHHTGADLYDCSYCSERFNSRNRLYTHKKNIHPVEYQEELLKRQLNN